MNRRKFVTSAGMFAAVEAFGTRPAVWAAQANTADYKLRIEPTTLDIGPGATVKTLAYNGQVPGPVLQVREGVRVTIDVTNAGPDADIVHWHGLAIDSMNDGAMEEGSPMIAPGKTQRYAF